MSEWTRRQLLQNAAASGAAMTLGACEAPPPVKSSPENLQATGRKGPSPLETLPPFENDYLQKRQAELRAAMEASQIAAVFLGPTLNLTYFTGARWSASERLFGCILFSMGEPAWIAPKFEDLRAGETMTGGELYTWEEWEDPHVLVAGIFKKRVAEGVIALDSHLRATHAIRLAQRLGAARVQDALAVIGNVRAVKSPAERARIGRANELTKTALQQFRSEILKPGISEPEAAGWLQARQQQLGLKNAWCLALFGPNAAFPHGTRERRTLREGEFALFDTGGELDGYQSDITRTYFAGSRPTERQRKIYQLVRGAQRAALAAARPGIHCGDVDAAARKIITDGGFGPGSKYFTHRLGHGIGLEGHEEPYFFPGNPLILKPGMTLSNEPGIYIPGELGVRIEDIIEITETGAAVLGGGDAEDLP